MPKCDRKKALEAVIKYVGEQHRGRLKVEDFKDFEEVEDFKDRYGYDSMRTRYKNYWVIHIPDPHDGMILDAPFRYLFISKDTCKIVD